MGTSTLTHGSTTPIQFTLSNFKRKDISQVVSQQQLSTQLQALQMKENEIKKYKYWEDFDRISGEITPYIAATSDQTFENMIKLSIFGSAFMTSLYIRHVYQSQFAWGLYKRYFWKILGVMLTLGTVFHTAIQTNHPIHDKFNRQLSPEQKCYRALDQEMDLYHNVDKIKYYFDYSRSDILKTRDVWNKNYLQHMEKQIGKQFNRVNGGGNSSQGREEKMQEQ